MEAADHIHGGFCRAGHPHCSPEKKAGGGGGGGGAGDRFVVEDLLDFSNEEEEEEEDKAEVVAGGGEDDGTAGGNSTDSSTVTSVSSNSFFGLEPHFSGDLFCRSFADAGLSGDLCEPLYDELAELEWLSNFVEESSSEDLHKLHLVSGAIPTASSCTTGAANRAEVSHDGGRADQVAHFRTEARVPGKARSKRSRSAPCSWSSRLLVLSSPLAAAAAASSPESEFVGSPCDGGGKKAAKKKDTPADPGMAVTDGRKCLHCQTDKTPQWRTGPMGPKTLCNACGVRYKSGRLVPEYRPAASPTYVVSKHSNSHRKVLELRRQKILRHQLRQSAAPFGGPTPVSNFLIPGPDIRHLI